MIKLKTFLIASGITLATVAAAQSPEMLKVKTLTLGNGLTVWINEDHTQPNVFGAVVVKAGSKDCPNTGIAHYFEHILFKGTDNIGTIDYAAEKPWLDSISICYDRLALTTDPVRRNEIQNEINRLSHKAGEYAIPNEFNNLISRYGGTELNAFTSYDETVFHNTFTPQYIAQWAELNSERLLNPVFRLFQSELETVYEEKNMYSDMFFMKALEAVLAAAADGTPYQWPIIGSTQNLKNPRLSEMQAFFNKYYVAGNMGLILCGDICCDSISQLLERTFGRIRPGTAPVAPPVVQKKFASGETVKIKIPIPIMKAEGYIYNAPLDRDADYEAFGLAMSLLSNSSETGLLDSLANENRVLAAFAGVPDLFRDLGLAAFGYVPRLPFGSRNKAGRLCDEQIERLKAGRFSDSELDALKKEALRDAEKELETMDTRAMMMIEAFSHGIAWDDVLGRPARIKAVTRDDVVSAANRYLGDSRLTLVKKFGSYPKDKVSQPGYKPVTPKHIGAKSEFARRLEQMPQTEAVPRFVDFARDAHTLKLGSLTTLYTVSNPVNDLFELQLIYKRGTLNDPRLDAVASYVTTLGTDSLTKQQFGRALQRIGSSLNIEANGRRFVITLSGFDSALRPSLALLSAFMRGVRHDKHKFSDLVSSEKIARKAFLRDNMSMATAVTDMICNGRKSGYLNQVTPDELKKLGGDKLIELFRELQSYELDIVYSGRLSDEEVEDAVRCNVPYGLVTHPHEDTFRPLQGYAEPVVYVYDNPDARQTIVGTYQQLPPAPDAESRTRQELWGQYFGSGMSSLLFQDIREFRSLAYYAEGGVLTPPLELRPNEPTAYITILGTQADKAMQALAAADSLLTDMPLRSEGVSIAKQGMVNSIVNTRPTFRTMGSTIAGWKMDGCTDDPRRKTATAIHTMGETDVTDYYNTCVKPAVRVTFVVGDKKKLNLGQLSKYGRIVELKREDIYK